MTRAALVGAILVAGGLFPVYLHHTRSYPKERRTILALVKSHPELDLVQLDVLDRGEIAETLRHFTPNPTELPDRGIVLRVRSRGQGVLKVIELTRALRNDARLARIFESPKMMLFPGCVWQTEDAADPRGPEIEVGILLRPVTN